MQIFRTLILAGLCSVFLAGAGLAQRTLTTNSRGDEVVVDMHAAFKRGDKAQLKAMLPNVRGHLLEPWGVYWELKARLEEASADEILATLGQLSGTYHEDRLRNDWLQLLGSRRDWAMFAKQYAQFRMRDDRQVHCYALHMDRLNGVVAGAQAASQVLRHWYAARDLDDGCALAVSALLEAKQVSALEVWKKARLSIESNRPRAASQAVGMVAPEFESAVAQLNANPARFLDTRASAQGARSQELVTLALIKMATQDALAAAAALETQWGAQLSPQARSWVWAVIGKQANMKLSAQAAQFFAKAQNSHLNDDLLAWKARAALRATDAALGWPVVLAAVNAMSEEGRKDSTWVYWKARALQELVKGSAASLDTTPQSSTPTTVLRAELQEAQSLLESIASPRGFYEILATQELGRNLSLPAAATALTADEKETARLNPGLSRALYAMALGLRAEGVREWNYTAHLHTPGGMSDRELLAAADLACQREVWDRCINTSERTKQIFSVEQRFPLPFREAVVKRSQAIGLDPAYVYGLIRQESRFIMDARSHVGASGLMQIMPATARWTAKKIGLTGFTQEQLNDRDTNIAIGTAYLKLVLDDFQGSSPLAAAAYNAGPSRPRAWRNGPMMEGAAWAENIPFSETRDYVKKVAANASIYGLILGNPLRLKDRLATIGPRDGTAPESNQDLP